MKVSLKRMNQAFHYEAIDSENLVVNIDGNPAIGGEGKGSRPMELMLMGIGGCASIDLGLILKKQKQILRDYSVEITGLRNEDEAKAFHTINLSFVLYGDLEEKKVERALDLSLQKYCSAINSLKESIKINYEYRIVR